MSNAELAVESVSVRFGGVVAIDNVSITLRQNDVLGLIGPNGAGKTTLVNVFSGFQKPSSGAIRLGERDLTGRRRHGFAQSGIVRTFQAVRLFKGLTVSENIEAGFVSRGITRAQARSRTKVLLDDFELGDKAHLPATGLSYGQERRAGLARALAMKPRFLLLDEPAAGVSAAEAEDLRQTIHTIRERYRCGVLVIEHNMALVMNLCDRLHVLDGGRTIAEGTPSHVRSNAAVRAAYLGQEAT